MSGTTEQHHGNSPAAWTAVVIILIGFLISAGAVLAALPVVFWLGLGVAALGVLVGRLMAMAGFGNMPSYTVQEPTPTSLEGPTLTTEPTEGV